ncbi:MAG: VOC family protein [Myxococcales bacterium]|nr:VOC family protein [Myxococcales bacterium]
MPSIAHVDYIELSAPATGPARAFYEQAFGWTFQPYGDAYAGFSDGVKEGEAGGINAMGEMKTPMVILYAADLEAARQGVIAAGGEILGPDLEFPGGRRFHFRDPAGNELAVWTKF